MGALSVLPLVPVGRPTVSMGTNCQVVASGWVTVRRRPSVVLKVKEVTFETALVADVSFPEVYPNANTGAANEPEPSGSVRVLLVRLPLMIVSVVVRPE